MSNVPAVALRQWLRLRLRIRLWLWLRLWVHLQLLLVLQSQSVVLVVHMMDILFALNFGLCYASVRIWHRLQGPTPTEPVLGAMVAMVAMVAMGKLDMHATISVPSSHCCVNVFYVFQCCGGLVLAPPTHRLGGLQVRSSQCIALVSVDRFISR